MGVSVLPCFFYYLLGFRNLELHLCELCEGGDRIPSASHLRRRGMAFQRIAKIPASNNAS